ncbi:mechanosensitive ion channel protein 1, mitochondrial-like [Salvia miltiorrhiza]|uniref:mechanosensitive ion channel protein 1, mitochondrial-like n=1 Tax=Salvia miltiorrhiza TaxID=226208 RepID=UPI0025AC543F|nr:mechanosensitive ion channel protein 1, mitochondrial-like [Salvia miltiorrhiza]
MAAMRISRMKQLYSVKSVSRFDVRPSVAYASKCYHTRESGNLQRFDQNGSGIVGFSSANFSQYCRGFNSDLGISNSLLRNSSYRGSLSFAGINPLINHRFFSSASDGKGATPGDVINSAGDVSVGGGDWTPKLKEAWESTVEAVKYAGEKAKEASDEVAPHVQQLLDAHPYLRDVIVPVGGTLAGTMLAWSLLPRLFRRFHKYSVEGPGALLSNSSIWGPVPYEESFWGALEAPVRYFVTFLAFLTVGGMVAPTTFASQYATQAWKGALVMSVVWFLHRWKTSVIARALVAKGLEGVRRDQLLTIDKISSVGLFIVGSMALAEACGVAMQSVLTVGGIGGVATAFASKDILGNVLSGLSVQLSQPFSIGDTIKAGSVEGQVVEMGLTTTSLLTADKFPVVVPNSLFSSQVIVNKSRAKFRSMVRQIPLQIDDIDKISLISEDIKSMLRSHSNVFLGKEAPYCFLSQIERSYAELTFGCNLKQVDKEAEQDILLDAVRIIKKHGATLGSTREDTIS